MNMKYDISVLHNNFFSVFDKTSDLAFSFNVGSSIAIYRENQMVCKLNLWKDYTVSDYF